MVKGTGIFTLHGASAEEGFLAMQHLYHFVNGVSDVEAAIGFDPQPSHVCLHVEVWVPREDFLSPFGGLMMRELTQAFDGKVTFEAIVS